MIFIIGKGQWSYRQSILPGITYRAIRRTSDVPGSWSYLTVFRRRAYLGSKRDTEYRKPNWLRHWGFPWRTFRIRRIRSKTYLRSIVIVILLDTFWFLSWSSFAKGIRVKITDTLHAHAIIQLESRIHCDRNVRQHNRYSHLYLLRPMNHEIGETNLNFFSMVTGFRK